MAEKNSFIFYVDWLDQVKSLALKGTAEDVASLCDAIKAYVVEREEIDLPIAADMVFCSFKKPLTESLDHYEKVCAKNKENSLKGVEARMQKNNHRQPTDNRPVPTDNRPVTNRKPTDNHEYEYDNEYDNGYDNGYEYVSPSGDITDASFDIPNGISHSLSCPELEKSTSVPAAVEPSVITLPLNTGEEWPVTSEMVAEWSSLYPAVDVMQALRSMRGWLIANPKNRKTKNGIKRFINTWLAKEQDRGGSTRQVARSGPRKPRDMSPQELIEIPIIDLWGTKGESAI